MKTKENSIDYEEFCDATGYNDSNLKMVYDLKRPIEDSTNNSLIRTKFLLYSDLYQ